MQCEGVRAHSREAIEEGPEKMGGLNRFQSSPRRGRTSLRRVPPPCFAWRKASQSVGTESCALFSISGSWVTELSANITPVRNCGSAACYARTIAASCRALASS
jgi:hypothetical protein